MRKIIFTLFLFLAGTFAGISQSISLSHGGGSINNGDTIKVYEDTTGTMIAHVDVANTSGNDLDVLAKKVELSLVQGMENFFCWTACYTPGTYLSPNPVTIPANSSVSNFDGEYQPKGNLGTSEVRYVFFVKGKENDSASVVVNYVATGAGIEGKTEDPEFSMAYPNPADDYVAFKYDLPGHVSDAGIIMRDMIGTKVKEKDISQNSGEISIDPHDLNKGIYFYSIVLDNKIYTTKKLVIKH